MYVDVRASIPPIYRQPGLGRRAQATTSPRGPAPPSGARRSSDILGRHSRRILLVPRAALRANGVSTTTGTEADAYNRRACGGMSARVFFDIRRRRPARDLHFEFALSCRCTLDLGIGLLFAARAARHRPRLPRCACGTGGAGTRRRPADCASWRCSGLACTVAREHLRARAAAIAPPASRSPSAPRQLLRLWILHTPDALTTPTARVLGHWCRHHHRSGLDLGDTRSAGIYLRIGRGSRACGVGGTDSATHDGRGTGSLGAVLPPARWSSARWGDARHPHPGAYAPVGCSPAVDGVARAVQSATSVSWRPPRAGAWRAARPAWKGDHVPQMGTVHSDHPSPRRDAQAGRAGETTERGGPRCAPMRRDATRADNATRPRASRRVRATGARCRFSVCARRRSSSRPWRSAMRARSAVHARVQRLIT
ncbi:hypothetical protein HYPSUDRAFT_983423 [Hypholoma sublateritium FD-334 SS-4]|uniref:Uncharacterized protein n=1 Tax=Hypholoma sublateritium (strain FD-334 SS-4) TaxID=945553 RepID=A0A0D2MSS2_HYPSF|nr:hypothetical protein HYPSUDRAFT_983423 [Hypholoma sublateritium FD-334 SS-4]